VIDASTLVECLVCNKVAQTTDRDVKEEAIEFGFISQRGSVVVP
jgi:hypothetical protein